MVTGLPTRPEPAPARLAPAGHDDDGGVAEHSLGKGEVVGSMPTGSAIHINVLAEGSGFWTPSESGEPMQNETRTNQMTRARA